MISSELLDARKEPVRDGDISYSLPMTLLKVNVVEGVDDKAHKKYYIAPFEGACKASDTNLCSEIATIPDPEHAYIVKFRGNILFDDELTLGVSEEGYLTQAKGKAIDQTGEILVSAIRTAFGDVPAPKSFGASLENKKIVDSILVDPHDPSFMEHANNVLRKYNLQIKCKCPERAQPVRGQSEEIYYRQKRTIFLIVTNRAGKFQAAYPISSFNGSPLIAHRLDRSPFVTRETEITYTNGVATNVVHKKPSEGLGFVTVVGKAAGAVVAAPFNALTIQTSNMSKQKEYLAAREELMKQQTSFAQAQAAATSKSFSAPLQSPGSAPQFTAEQLIELQKRLPPANDAGPAPQSGAPAR